MLVAQLKTELAQHNTGGGNGGGGRGGGRRRQRRAKKYDKYCFSRGVNLECDGSNCRPHCKKRADHDPTATYHNRGNGSTKLLGRWGKWYGPDGKLYIDEACTKPFSE